MLHAAEKADPLSPSLHFVYGDLLTRPAATRRRLGIARGRRTLLSARVVYCWPKEELTMRLRFSRQPRMHGISVAPTGAPGRQGVEKLAALSRDALQQVLIYAGLLV
jgi:hypothetical protein